MDHGRSRSSRVWRACLPLAGCLVCLWVTPGPAGVKKKARPGGTHDLSGRVKVLWDSRYDGPASDVDAAEAMAVSPDGTTVFVTGYSRNSSTDSEYATVAIDAQSGEQLWASRYGAPDYLNSARAIAVSPDSRKVFVTGLARSHYATIAYDAASGREIWSTEFG